MGKPAFIPSGRFMQPTGPCLIDKGNTLCDGLVFAAVAQSDLSWYEVFTQQRAYNNGSLRYRKTVDGNACEANSQIGGNTTPTAQFTNATGLDRISGACTLFIEGSLEVNNTEQGMIKSYEGGGGTGWACRFDDTNAGVNHFRVEVNNSAEGTGCSGALGTNSEQFTHRVMLTLDGTNVRYYAKRVLKATNAYASLPTASTSRRTYMLSNFGASATQASSAGLVLAWNRVLGLTEYGELFDNPNQVFMMQRNLWAAVVAAAAGTVKFRKTLSGIGTRTGSRQGHF